MLPVCQRDVGAGEKKVEWISKEDETHSQFGTAITLAMSKESDRVG